MISPIEPYGTDGQKTTRIGYLLHKPLRGYICEKEESKNVENKNIVSEQLKELVINITNSYPELQLKDDLGIIASVDNDNLLARLAESDFDLSILP